MAGFERISIGVVSGIGPQGTPIKLPVLLRDRRALSKTEAHELVESVYSAEQSHYDSALRVKNLCKQLEQIYPVHDWNSPTPGCYVYLIHSPILGLYKIGRTRCPAERFISLMKEIRDPDLSVVHAVLCQDSVTAEKEIHEVFEKMGVRKWGEWFDLLSDGNCCYKEWAIMEMDDRAIGAGNE